MCVRQDGAFDRCSVVAVGSSVLWFRKNAQVVHCEFARSQIQFYGEPGFQSATNRRDGSKRAKHSSRRTAGESDSRARRRDASFRMDMSMALTAERYTCTLCSSYCSPRQRHDGKLQ